MKKLVLLLVCVILFLMPTVSVSAQTAYIDNGDLMPKYVPDSQVKLVQNGDLQTPEWVSSLIMAEMRIETVSEEGTFAGAVKALDHFVEMGVNGLWINPIYDHASYDNGYGNFGPHTVNPALTGKKTYEESWQVVKWFVDEAHKRNIRIFFDIITWGTGKEAPVYKEHPDWYAGFEAYNGYVWKWSNKAWQNWFADKAVKVMEVTGADGFRVDLEPDNTGYALFAKIRKTLYDEGRKVVIFSEGPNTRDTTYDFEQSGVGQDLDYDKNQPWLRDDDFFTKKYNLVDAIKKGTGIGVRSEQAAGNGGAHRFYTYMSTCHDSGVDATVKGDRIRFAYQAIFTPFIPLFFIGEEWNNPWKSGVGVLYYNAINWKTMDKADNRAFYEDVKQYLRIRRSYPEIFEYWPEDHRKTNICKVSVANTTTDLQPYARYGGGKGVLIIPNADIFDRNMTITVPWSEIGEGSGTYAVTDGMTGKVITSGTADKLRTFKASVPAEGLGVYIVEKSNAPTTTTTKTIVKTTTTIKTMVETTFVTTAGTTAEATERTVPTAETPTTEEPETTVSVETEVPTDPVETEDPAETEAPVETETPTEEPETEPVDGEPDFPLIPVIIGGAVALAAIAAVVLLLIKRK